MTKKEISLRVENVTKTYGKTIALNDFSINIDKGGIVGLLGPNGSGKTTLIKILTGLLKDYKGQVSIDDNKPNAYTKSIVSYLPDVDYFEDWMKVKDAVSMFEDVYLDFDSEKAKKLLEKMNLNINMKIKAMSKGMKEKLQLILVMSRNAKIYILDEPIAGVDPAARDLILDTIISNYDEDSLVLFSTHLISDIERMFDQVIFIKNGELVLHRDAEELRLERGKTIDEIFREEFKC